MSLGNGRIPEGWVEVQLGEFMASTPNVVPSDDPSTEFELWSVPAFESEAPEIQDGSAIGSNKQVVEPHDVLLCKINPRINRVWKVGEAAGRPQIASTEWIVLRSSEIDPVYLMYHLREPEIRHLLASNVSGVGGSLTRVRPTVVREISIKLPPLTEQRRIVARIEDLQARTRRAREALEGVPTLIEQFRQSVLASAFRGDLTANWREKHPDMEPAKVLLQRVQEARRRQWEAATSDGMRAKGKEPKDDHWKQKYKEPEPLDTSGLPELPEGWAWASIEQLSSAVDPICYGVVQPGKEVPNGIRLVRVCDIEGGRVAASNLRTISADVDRQYERSRLSGKEVLVTVVGTIGRVAVVPDGLAGANIARAVARIVPSDSIPSAWVKFALESPWVQQWLTREAREVARKTLNIGTLAQTGIPVAPLSEMNAILELLPTTQRQADTIKRSAASAQSSIDRQEQAILAKAFRGELVAQDTSDEPASMLLDRIRRGRDQQRKRGRKP